MTRDELIAALEAATGPDHELNISLHEWVLGRARGSLMLPSLSPTYTSSIDAALTLVPEGLAWTLGQNIHHRHWLAAVNALDADGAPHSVGMGHHAMVPALALCIAALRARSVAP